MNFTVYKSSAGSGKTFTLVKEYLKLILQSDQPDKYRQILAVTFTNKAANEMKERVIKVLTLLSAADSTEEDSPMLAILVDELQTDRKVLKERAGIMLEHILHHYADFSIGTIDKFVHRVIRTFAHDLKIPMNFEVELDSETLLQEAIDLLINQAGRDEQLTRALVEFTESKAADEKSWHIEHDLFRFASGLLNEDNYLYIEKLREISIEDIFEIRKILNTEIKDFEKRLQHIGEQAINTIHSNGINPGSFAGGASRGIYKYFSYLSENRADKFLPSATIVNNMEEGKWHAGKATTVEKSEIDAVSDKLSEQYFSAQGVVENGLQNYRLYTLINRNIYPLAVLNETEKILTDIKQEKNLLHISEFNRRIARIVMSEPAPFIYERLGERYRHYLIDEFQDTSVLQWQNLLPLIDNSLSTGNFNMIVGDGKQAIYRWRGGEVEQFSRLPGISYHYENPLIEEREASLTRNYKGKVLESNYRSKAEIVRFNNWFFKNLSTQMESGLQDIYAALEQKFDPENTGGQVSIEVIDNTDQDSFKENVLKKTAACIRGTVEDRYRLSDIAVLCRSNKEGSEIAGFLIDQGIDVVSSESLLLSASPKIRLVIAFMNYLNRPDDMVAKAEILLCLKKNNKLVKPLHDSLSKLTDPKGFQDILTSIGIKFSPGRFLPLPLTELIEALVRLLQFNQPDPFISAFLDFSNEFVSKQPGHLPEFLDTWDDKKNKLSISMPEGLDAVTIMTIHKSKGLQFPVIIVPFANWAAGSSTDNLWVNLSPPLFAHPEVNSDEKSTAVKAGPSKKYPSLNTALLPNSSQLTETSYEHIYEEEKNKSLLDNFNLLYVAFTRPEERLHVFTSEPGRFKSLSGYFLPFISADENWNEAQGVYRSGEKIARTSKKTAEISGEKLNLSHWISGEWRSRIAISMQAPEIWEEEHTEKHKNYGKLLHKALSYINSAVDIDSSLERMFCEGWLNHQEREEFKLKLDSLLRQEKIKALFEREGKVKNEAELLLADGSIYRPDRVIISDKLATVIDFKTGKALEEHKGQLNKYAGILLEMGHQQVKKYLIYTESETVIAV